MSRVEPRSQFYKLDFAARIMAMSWFWWNLWGSNPTSKVCISFVWFIYVWTYQFQRLAFEVWSPKFYDIGIRACIVSRDPGWCMGTCSRGHWVRNVIFVMVPVELMRVWIPRWKYGLLLCRLYKFGFSNFNGKLLRYDSKKFYDRPKNIIPKL